MKKEEIRSAIELFPDADTRKRDLRSYLEERMIELALNGDLRVTEILNTPLKIRSYCGEIILGQGRVDSSGDDGISTINTANHMFDLPDELQAYKVGIEVINRGVDSEYQFCNKIRWRTAMQKDRQYRHLNAMAGLFGDEGVALMKDTWHEVDGPKANVSLPEAWSILKAQGEFCSYAKRTAMQKTKWIYREQPAFSAKDLKGGKDASPK